MSLRLYIDISKGMEDSPGSKPKDPSMAKPSTSTPKPGGGDKDQPSAGDNKTGPSSEELEAQGYRPVAGGNVPEGAATARGRGGGLWYKPTGQNTPKEVKEEVKSGKAAEVPSESPEAPTDQDMPKSPEGARINPFSSDGVAVEHADQAIERLRESGDDKAAHAMEKEKTKLETAWEAAEKTQSDLSEKPKGWDAQQQRAEATKKKERVKGLKERMAPHIESELKKEAQGKRESMREATRAAADHKKKVKDEDKKKRDAEKAEAKKKTDEQKTAEKEALAEVKNIRKKKEAAKKAEAKAKSDAAKAAAKKKTDEQKAAEKEALAEVKNVRKKKEAAKKEEAKVQAAQDEITPKNKSDEALVSGHADAAQTAIDNIQSHLDNNPDIDDATRAKLERTMEGLQHHTAQSTIPTSKEKSALSSITKQGGDHSKKAYEPPQQEESRPPSTDEEHLALDSHKASVAEMKRNAQAHLDSQDLSPEDKKKIEGAMKVLEKHEKLDTVPTADEMKELKQMKTQLGTHAKAPKEAAGGTVGAEGEGADKKNPKLTFNAGRARQFGSQVAEGASDTSSGGAALGQAAVDYGVGGAVSAGHHLLSSAKDRAEKKAKEKAEVEQSSLKGLYITDLMKAISTSTSSSAGATPNEDRSTRRYNESFGRQTAGVSGDHHPTDDDPDVGKRWRDGDDADDDETLESELEEKREKASESAKDKGVVKAPTEALNMVKSLTDRAAAEVAKRRPRQEEADFLVQECGYSYDDVYKGRAVIRGRDRRRFNDWLCKRMELSVDSLKRSLS